MATIVVAIDRSQNIPWLLIVAFFASGFIADMATAFAHFGFDYVFPHDFPILGPISAEFNEHHVMPSLDPTSYLENFTKGAYASLPTALVAGSAALLLPDHGVANAAVVTMCYLPAWALFFHQMHSYAHMGSELPAETFHEAIVEIERIDDPREQRRQLRALFATVPIHPVIRILQRLHLTLDPERHNLHHVRFESDFSSVNGWSDPVLNPVFGRLARHYKSKRAAPPA